MIHGLLKQNARHTQVKLLRGFYTNNTVDPHINTESDQYDNYLSTELVDGGRIVFLKTKAPYRVHAFRMYPTAEAVDRLPRDVYGTVPSTTSRLSLGIYVPRYFRITFLITKYSGNEEFLTNSIITSNFETIGDYNDDDVIDEFFMFNDVFDYEKNSNRSLANTYRNAVFSTILSTLAYPFYARNSYGYGNQNTAQKNNQSYTTAYNACFIHPGVHLSPYTVVTMINNPFSIYYTELARGDSTTGVMTTNQSAYGQSYDEVPTYPTYQYNLVGHVCNVMEELCYGISDYHYNQAYNRITNYYRGWPRFQAFATGITNMSSIPDITAAIDQLQPMDTINCESDHVIVVIKIYKDVDGNDKYYCIIESSNPSKLYILCKDDLITRLRGMHRSEGTKNITFAHLYSNTTLKDDNTGTIFYGCRNFPYQTECDNHNWWPRKRVEDDYDPTGFQRDICTYYGDKYTFNYTQDIFINVRQTNGETNKVATNIHYIFLPYASYSTLSSVETTLSGCNTLTDVTNASLTYTTESISDITYSTTNYVRAENSAITDIYKAVTPSLTQQKQSMDCFICIAFLSESNGNLIKSNGKVSMTIFEDVNLDIEFSGKTTQGYNLTYFNFPYQSFSKMHLGRIYGGIIVADVPYMQKFITNDELTNGCFVHTTGTNRYGSNSNAYNSATVVYYLFNGYFNPSKIRITPTAISEVTGSRIKSATITNTSKPAYINASGLVYHYPNESRDTPATNAKNLYFDKSNYLTLEPDVDYIYCLEQCMVDEQITSGVYYRLIEMKDKFFREVNDVTSASFDFNSTARYIWSNGDYVRSYTYDANETYYAIFNYPQSIPSGTSYATNGRLLIDPTVDANTDFTNVTRYISTSRTYSGITWSFYGKASSYDSSQIYYSLEANPDNTGVMTAIHNLHHPPTYCGMNSKFVLIHTNPATKYGLITFGRLTTDTDDDSNAWRIFKSLADLNQPLFTDPTTGFFAQLTTTKGSSKLDSEITELLLSDISDFLKDNDNYYVVAIQNNDSKSCIWNDVNAQTFDSQPPYTLKIFKSLRHYRYNHSYSPYSTNGSTSSRCATIIVNGSLSNWQIDTMTNETYVYKEEVVGS